MIVRTATELGLLMRQVRIERGLTQVDLAQRIDTTVKWVSHVENGKPTAEIGLVLRALLALGIEPDMRTSAHQPEPSVEEPGDDAVPYRL